MSLRQQVLDEITACIEPFGIRAADVAATLGASRAEVDQAIEALRSEGLAVRFKAAEDGKTVRIIAGSATPAGYRVCVRCERLFTIPMTPRGGGRFRPSKRLTCSRFCHSALGWGDATIRAERGKLISQALCQPETSARIVEHNKKRWNRPGEREKLAERNRKAWADPATKIMLSVRIKKFHASKEGRELFSRIRREWWADPENRARAMASMKGKMKPRRSRA